jgi:membrane protein required for colicin V production
MQSYDVLMILVMGGAVLFGFWKGFAWQVASVASIIVSYLVARNFADVVASKIGGDPAWNKFLAMFVLFFGCSLAIWVLFGFVRNSIERMHLRTFDRQIGGALGAVKGALLCILITLFSVSLLGETVCKTICTSRSGNYVAQALAKLHGIVPPEIRNYVGPYVDRFNNEMIEHQNALPVALPGGINFPEFRPGSLQPDMSWRGAAEEVGRLEPVPPGATIQPGWTGQLERIDWGKAAGQAVESIVNSQARR